MNDLEDARATELTDQLIERYCAVHDLQVVATAFELSAEAVHDVLQRNGVFLLNQQPIERTYSDEEVLSCFLQAAEGKTLSKDGYERYRKDRTLADGRPWPSYQQGHLRWGTWNAALEAAGLPTHKRPRRSYQSKWSDKEIFIAIRKADRSQATHDRFISAANYATFAQAHKGDVPSLGLIRMRFGSWSAAVRKARGWESSQRAA